MKYIFGVLITVLGGLSLYAYYYEIQADEELKFYQNMSKEIESVVGKNPFNFTVVGIGLHSTLSEIETLYPSLNITELNKSPFQKQFSDETWDFIKSEVEIPEPWGYLATVNLVDDQPVTASYLVKLKEKTVREDYDVLGIMLDHNKEILAINRYKSIFPPVDLKKVESNFINKYGKYSIGSILSDTTCWGKACNIDDSFLKTGASLTLITEQYPEKNTITENYKRITEDDAEIFFITTLLINHDATFSQLEPIVTILNDLEKNQKELKQRKIDENSNFTL